MHKPKWSNQHKNVLTNHRQQLLNMDRHLSLESADKNHHTTQCQIRPQSKLQSDALRQYSKLRKINTMGTQVFTDAAVSIGTHLLPRLTSLQHNMKCPLPTLFFLMQEADNRKKIIAVASHIFSPSKWNWSTTEPEAVIKLAISKFLNFLRNCSFIIINDHRLLTYLNQREFNNTKIWRWQEEISCNKFVPEFIEGELNVWADMLSRSHGQKKRKMTADSNPTGKVFKI